MNKNSVTESLTINNDSPLGQTLFTENISQFDQHAIGRSVMIDFSIANNGTTLITAEIAENHQQDLLDRIRSNQIFDHMVRVTVGKLSNGCTRILCNFDESKFPTDVNFAMLIGSPYVVRVPAETEFPGFNAVNLNPMPLCVMDDPEEAFREILRELAERFEKSFSTRDSSTCCTEGDRDE